MATANATFTELVTTTFRNHRKELKDNMSKHNALLRRITAKKKTRYEDGGLTIAVPLEYGSNVNYKRYSGYDTLLIDPSEVISAAEYAWRQIAIAVVASGLELRINSGENRIINLVKTRMQNAIRTFKNNFSVDLYSDGTLTNQIGGLQLLVSSTGAGTVGGIDSTTWPFWQSKVQSAAAPIQGGGAITVGATTIESLMLPLWLALVRGDDKPSMILADSNYFTFYEQSQLSLKRYTSSDEAQGGFMSLKYKSADVIFDGGSGIPANRMYFLNEDYFQLVVHKDADLTTLEDIRPVQQDASVVPIIWQGNLVCSNRSLQGVLRA